MIRSTHLKAILVALFLGLTAIFLVSENVYRDTILVLHSAGADDAVARRVDIGLRRAFGTKMTMTIRTHYMDAGMAPDLAGEERIGTIAKKLVEKLKPTVLVTVGDDAQQYVARDLAGRTSPAIVFTGISGDISRYGFIDQPNVTGVIDSRPYGAMRDMLLAANTFRPDHPMMRVFHLSADYEKYEYPDPKIAQYDWKPLALVDSRRVATLEEWQAAVKQAQRTADVIIVSIDEGMRHSASDPTIASVHEILDWTEANSTIPVLGLTLSNVEDGCMAAVGVSPFEQGLIAGKLAIDLADRHIPASSMKIAKTAQFVVALRESAMRRRGFQVPAIYHAFASATEQDRE